MTDDARESARVDGPAAPSSPATGVPGALTPERPPTGRADVPTVIDPDHTCKARCGDALCGDDTTVRVTFDADGTIVTTDLCAQHATLVRDQHYTAFALAHAAQ